MSSVWTPVGEIANPETWYLTELSWITEHFLLSPCLSFFARLSLISSCWHIFVFPSLAYFYSTYHSSNLRQFSLASSYTFVSCITCSFKYPSNDFYCHQLSTSFCVSEATQLLCLRITGDKKLRTLEKLQKVPAWEVATWFSTGSRICWPNLLKSCLVVIGQLFH